MATISKLNLTRNKLAEFLPDHESIRQFEQLFAVADAMPDTVDQLGTQAGDADQKASLALSQVAALSQEAMTAAASAENKAAQAMAAVDAVRGDVAGLQMAPPPRELSVPRYGSFFDTTTQTATTINTAYAMTFDSTDLSFGVTRGSPTSRIVVDRAGVYNIQFSAQLDNSSGGDHLAHIWLRVSGTDVPQSAGQLRMKGNNAELVPAWNWLASLKANDYIEIMWEVDDVAVQLVASAAAAPVPAIPSVILTVTSNIQGQS